MTTDLSKVVTYYESGVENDRLASGIGRLELARTESLLRRLLPPAPSRVLDVGGGPGRYAAMLAHQGYEVVLVDPVPLHVEEARARVVAIEGPFWLLSDIDTRAADHEGWELLLATVNAIEAEPSMIGANNHLLVSGVKAPG